MLKRGIGRLPVVVLAAGLSSRYGSLKQLEPVGPSDEALMDYAIFDAWRGAGATEVLLVVRPEILDPVRTHVVALVGGRMGVSPVVQEPDDLPGGADPPPDREKPWGTGHALWCCRNSLDPGPFLLVNADDFYGLDTFRALGRWSAEAPSSEAALVPFRLVDSLSEHGGVNRAVCRVSRDGWLQEIEELFEIRRRPDAPPGEPGLEGRDRNGERVLLERGRLYSSNVWGFTSAVFPTLGEAMVRFLEARAGDPEAEFLIADGLRPAMMGGDIRIRVLEPGEGTLGVTHPEDRAGVEDALARLVAAGAYPEDLRDGFRAG